MTVQIADMKRIVGTINLDDKKIDKEIVKTIIKRISQARSKHPEGPSLNAFVSEVAEVLEAYSLMNDKDIIYELYDIIAISYRIIRKKQSHEEFYNVD